MEPALVVNLVVFVLVMLVAGLTARRLLPKVSQHFQGRSGGGWKKLAETYPAAGAFAREIAARRSIQVGSVLYKNCVNVYSDPQGLGLARSRVLPFVGKSAPVLVPWPAIRKVQTVKLFWRKAFLLSIGDPQVITITLPAAVFEAIEANLQGALAADAGGSDRR